MATGFSKSYIQKASDLIYDFVCSPCEENDFNSAAVYFCKQCAKQYCDKCVSLHNEMYRKHTLLDDTDLQHWGKVKSVVAMEMCEEHYEKLKTICIDHDQLCCKMCVSTLHGSCLSMERIQEVAKGIHNKSEFRELSSDVIQMTSKLDQAVEERNTNRKAIEDTCTQILSTIEGMKTSLTQSLDKLKIETVEEMNKLLAELDSNIHEDVDNCIGVRVGLKKVLRDIQGKAAQQESLSYIGFKKCQTHLSEGTRLLQDMHDCKIEFHPDRNIEQYLCSLSMLGQFQTEPRSTAKGNEDQSGTSDTNNELAVSGARTNCQTIDTIDNYLGSSTSTSNKSPIYKVHTRKTYPVNISNDKKKCNIQGLCQLPNGNIVITDASNQKVKLLNQSYAVIAHRKVPPSPHGVCHTTGMEVAIAVNWEYPSKHKIYFFDAKNGKLEETRKKKLHHACYSLAHHNGHLYVGTGNAIYIYTTSGNKVKCLYEDISGEYSTVRDIAVSDDGQMVYIADRDKEQLVTLDKHGKQLATLSDPDLKIPSSVCMAGNGYVFISGDWSSAVLQVDPTGRQKVTTVTSCAGEANNSWSLYFNRDTSELIVGQSTNSDIVVLTMK